ncbi:MAG: 2-oxo acid dehydrogenase subunit E2 [Chloroflexi bacterium]|nr:2-oxo acid dehydrogenase subunit E2 [Chloroflexota bacterium]
MATEIIMPVLGEGVIEGQIARWLKKEGDKVKRFEPILEIETDKVTTEATAEIEGVLLQILVAEGETVPVGTVLAYLGTAGESVTEAAAPQSTPVSAPESAPVTTSKGINGQPGNGSRSLNNWASPVVRRMASEHDLDLSQISGTGRDGRITKKDVVAYLEAPATEKVQVETAAAPTPLVTPQPQPQAIPKPAPVPTMPTPVVTPGLADTLSPLTNMRRAIADHMVMSKRVSPHVTTVFEFDFSTISKHREAHKAAFARDGANLTFTAYLVAATAQALKAHPMVNSSWSDEGVVLRRSVNVGLAAAIEDGLIVPVIKDADNYNLLGLARVVNDLTNRARNKQLKPGDVQGGTFTITNHGVSGSLFATPIINQPQCGILGVGKIEKRVKVIDDAIAIRPMAYVSFTFDHRILDGASADHFVSTLKEIIENWH